jgi:lipopolysaccharide export system permease protein
MISRYLLKELLITTLAVVFILSFLGLSNKFVTNLAQAARGDLPAELIFKAVYLSLPSLLSMLLPIGFFLGLLLAYGKLYADSEMTVLFACGMSMKRLIVTTMGLAMVMLCFMLWLSLWSVPRSLLNLQKMIATADANLLTTFLHAGRFQSYKDGQYVIYLEGIDKSTKQLNHIFVAEQPAAEKMAADFGRISVMTAASGYLWRHPNTKEEYIVLKGGNRYLGEPGTANYTIAHFDEFGVRVDTPPPMVHKAIKMLSTRDLWGAWDDPKKLAELQWRLTLPLSIIVLAVLGIPLSRVPPRKGKYASLFPSVVVIIIYVNLLVITRTWTEEKIIGFWFGLLWVHLLGLGVGIALILRQTNFWYRWWYQWKVRT